MAPLERSTARFALALCGALACAPALANSDPFTGIAAPGGAGVGAFVRTERSPYRGAGQRHDFLPLYLYEGKHGYLHSHSVGLKFGEVLDEPRFDIFLRYRFEGFPYDRIPDSIAGMAKREGGIDAGASAQIGGAWGIAFVEGLHDVSATSRGTELRLGYRFPWRSGRLWLRPHAFVGYRNARLNDYYYGVRPGEATPTRPAYSAHAGMTAEVGLYAAYSLTERWRLIGGLTFTRWPSAVRDSPITEVGTQRQLTLGAMYDITPEHEAWPEGRPLIVRVYHGDSSDCNVLQIAELRCTTTHTRDRTGITGIDIGRPFIERLNGWPLDIAGFVGLIRHYEAGFQQDFWQVNAYFKAYYYGFPWAERVRTRVGLGVGLAYAQRISLMEARDLAQRGRNTSKLLETLDPTVDVSVGDLIGVRSMRETYVGLGVSHRSGIFASSQLLGNVNGGSNFIYTYLETSF